MDVVWNVELAKLSMSVAAANKYNVLKGGHFFGLVFSFSLLSEVVNKCRKRGPQKPFASTIKSRHLSENLIKVYY